jgi:hypothetical protein
MGLIDNIRVASKVAEVEKLFVEGKAYTNASLKTQRRWKYVAVKRLKELDAVKVAPTKAPVAEKRKPKT